MEPLASNLRPLCLETYVGQEHLVGPNMPLRVAIEKKHIFSFILWGPPGVGKTTLARLYARAIGADYHELSAVSAGKDEIRKILKIGSASAVKVLFLDEIHRFNKAQQDFLLPYVETGALTLVGATTENPSFAVIAPLLSRCRVFTLHELDAVHMQAIIKRAGFIMDDEAESWLIAMANGDARQMLSMLENTAQLYKTITISTLKNTLQNKYLRYDKKGEEHYNVISAFIKSMRASQPDAALYYLARMVDAGEDPLFIARRMVIFASEDIGLADAKALMIANDVFRACQSIGYPECAINLAHGACYLARAPKSRASYNAYFAALDDVKEHGNLLVPHKLRNAPTSLMKAMSYGKDYEAYTKESLLPEKLKNKRYLEV